MFAIRRRAARFVAIGVVCLCVLNVANSVHAQGNVVMGFDALMAINTSDTGGTVMGSNPSWGGFGRFSYGGMTVGPSTELGLGRYGAFEIRKDGAGGSGMGFNFTLSGQADNPVDAGVVIPNVAANMFPLLDRSGFGVNFDPSQYVAELVFKPMPGNNGNQLNLTLDTFDGFNSAGERFAEQIQWNFFDLANPNPATDPDITGPDADGFYTVRNTGPTGGQSLSRANAGFQGPSYMFQTAPLPGVGDNEADFHEFEAMGVGGILPVPNGVRQIHIQTPYNDDSTVDYFSIKALRLVKLAPNTQEVARLDSRSGFSLRFGSPFRRGDTDPPINIGGTDFIPSDGNVPANTDQVSRFNEGGFTNIELKSHDDDQVGGLALWQPGSSQVFDGTNARVEVTAKLKAEQGAGQADRIILVLKDKDGNDTGAGQGGDEYHYDLLLNQFNTSTMTTIPVQLSAFTRLTAGEFVNEGDNSLANFNLYYMGLETVQDIGLVNLEIESIRVLLPGVAGDYNGNGVVDAADHVLWRNGGPLANDPTPGVQPADYDFWKSRFGATSGSGSGGEFSAAVPEPAGVVLALLAMLAVAGTRRR
jgi:hypothetical protein